VSLASYRTLLRAPGAAAFFLTAAAGRVGIAMTSLGIVWLVHARTGSYTTAAMQISVTAFAAGHGAAGTAAALFTVSSCASLLAGWMYGLRQWPTAPRVQLALAAAGLAIGCLPLLVAGSPGVSGGLGGGFHRSAQKTEFVALGVGEYVPGFLAGLSHVGLSGAEFEETL
jgi:hypothetical protein